MMALTISKRFLWAFPLLLLAACAGPVTMAPQGNRAEVLQETQRQQEMLLERYVNDQAKVSSIAFPILTANAEFCGRRTEPLLGLSAWSLATVPKNYRTAAQSLYGVDNRLSVRSVASHSPAARAGVRGGDIIVAVNDVPLPQGPQALATASRIVEKGGYEPVRFIVERQGRPLTLTVMPSRGCNFPVLLDNTSNAVNAYADGEKIVISRGLLRFAENDNEIAMVIAHELGHSALDHVGKMQQNAAVGALGGLAVDSLLAAVGVGTGGQFTQAGGQMGAYRFSVPFEQEADYVGMYFMERAGYNAAGVANFWRRMAAEGQSSVAQRTTHPTSPERFIAIERSYQEIADKKRRGLALTPNMAPRR